MQAEAGNARIPATRLHGPLRKVAPLDHGCLASLISSEPPEFSQLILPLISRHAPELEPLAAANAFEQGLTDLSSTGGSIDCPSGRELIQRFLLSSAAG